MAVASVVKKLTYIGRENTPGTEVPANKHLRGTNLRLLPNNTRGEVRPSGSLLRTDRPEIMDWSTFSIAPGSALDYNSTLYALAGICALPTTTTPGGATNAREHAGIFLPDGSSSRAAYTMVTGYRGGTAEKTIRNVFNSFSFGFSRRAAPTIGGGGYGRNADFGASLGVNEVQTITIDATGGDFDVTFDGQTAASVAYDASANTLQTALEGLSNLVPGDVVVTKQGSVFTITFQGAYANTNVPALTTDPADLTGGGSTAVVATSQAGGITDVPVRAIQSPEWDVYCDSAAGDIGTTKIRPYSGAFAFNGLTEPDWVVDTDLDSYDDDVVLAPDGTLNIVMRNDATARSLRADLKAGDTKYIRFQATGPEIESGQNYLFRIDCAVKAGDNLGQFGEDSGRETLPLPLTIISDSDFASGGWRYLLRNAIASL